MEQRLDALRDPNPDVQETTAVAPGHLGDARAVQPLIGLTHSSEASGRGAPAWAPRHSAQMEPLS